MALRTVCAFQSEGRNPLNALSSQRKLGSLVTMDSRFAGMTDSIPITVGLSVLARFLSGRQLEELQLTGFALQGGQGAGP